MKKRLTALALALSCAGTGFAQDAPRADLDSLKQQSANLLALPGGSLYGNLENAKEEIAAATGVSFALFVGCELDEQNPMPATSFSKADLASAETLLRERAGLNDAYAATMTNESKSFFLKPTRANVLAMLRRVAEEARENDSIWVVFSGEGFSVEGDAAFVPSVAGGDASQWVFASEARAILASSRANRVAIVWLTDRFERADLKKPEEAQAPAVEARKDAERVEIFACSQGERTRESTQAKLDLFWSEFLTAAKTSEGAFGGEALRKAFNAAAAKTFEATKDSEAGAQTPEWRNF